MERITPARQHVRHYQEYRSQPMHEVFEVKSFVSTDAAWHQELTFDEPCVVTVMIENLGSDPIYGFYLNEDDFQAMVSDGVVDDEVMTRIQTQLVCENECGLARIEVHFPTGRHFVCLELDAQSQPGARRTEFLFSLHEESPD